jgi:DNA invertase Pin-like site-specific DNA recombinase
VSLEAQDAKIRAYSALYGLNLVEVIVDAGASAKTLDRPGLARALGMLHSGAAQALLVVKLDRLTRSVRDLGTLVEEYFDDPSGPALLSVSDQIDTRTAAGRLVLNVLGAVSQWEREAIGERTSAAMRHMAAKGEYVGGAPRFGYRLAEDGRLEAQEGEQAVIRQARALRGLWPVAPRRGGPSRGPRVPEPCWPTLRGSPGSPHDGGCVSPKAAPKRREAMDLYAFRLPDALIAQVDAYAERLKEEAPWSNPTRADAVRALLVAGLEAVGPTPRPRASSRARRDK